MTINYETGKKITLIGFKLYFLVNIAFILDLLIENFVPGLGEFGINNLLNFAETFSLIIATLGYFVI